MDFTVSGYTCMEWDLNDYSSNDYPFAGLEYNNYCRNPDYDENGAWCYTIDSDDVYWEYCDLSLTENPANIPESESSESESTYPY